jgi:hypothetical protein
MQVERARRDMEATMTVESERNVWPEQPSRELRRLSPLVGTWRTAGDTRPTKILGGGVPVSSWETFEWLDGGHFLVQRYHTVFGDEPAQRGVVYWMHDDATRRFRNIFFSNNGPYTEEGNRYEGEVVEGRLTYEGPARFQYELDDEGRIKVDADGSITVTWWLPDGAGGWQPWMTNRFVRAE